MDNSLEAFSSNPRYSPGGLEEAIEAEELTEARRVDTEKAAISNLESQATVTPKEVEAAPPEENDVIATHEKVLGVVDAFTRVPRDITGGLHKATSNTLALVVGRDNLDSANQWLNENMPGLTEFTNKFEKGIAPVGVASGVTQELTQFMAPFGLYMKGLKAMGAGTFTSAFAADVLASGTALDPHMERLSSLAKEMGVENQVIGWLADNENETESEGRLKNIIESVGVGAAVAVPLTTAALTMKGLWRLSKMPKAAKKAIPKKKVKPKKPKAEKKSATKDDLVVANKYEGGIVSGKRGELHFSVMREDKGKLIESGFTDSKGNFYNRNEAIEYAKKSVPDVKGMDETVSPRYSGLDAKDLNFARTGDEMPLLTSKKATPVRLTKAERKYFDEVSANDADLKELMEAAPSTKVTDKGISVDPEDIEGIIKYIDDTARLREGRVPPGFINDKFTKRLQESRPLEDKMDNIINELKSL